MKKKFFLSLLATIFQITAAQALPEHIGNSAYKTDVVDFYENEGRAGSFIGAKDVNIVYRKFVNPTAKSSIVFVAGLGESVEKYAELVSDLYRAGYSVYVMDHRGQGRSGRLLADPQIAHVDSFRYWIADLESFIQNIVRSETVGRVFLMAHSMGGGIATGVMINNPSLVDAAVLSAPMHQFKTNGIPEPIVRLLSGSAVLLQLENQYMPGAGPYDPREKTFVGNKYTHSVARYRRMKELYENQPSLTLGGPSYGWVRESLRLTRFIRGEAASLNTPVLILQAGHDQTVINTAHDFVCSKSRTCQLEKLPESLHEILIETDSVRETALQKALLFFQSHPHSR